MTSPQINFAKDIFNDFIYDHALFNESRYLVLKGGAGSGKSYGAVQKLLVRALSEERHRIVMTRKVSNTIRKSQYKLIGDCIKMYGLEDLFDIRDSDMTITVPSTKSEFIAVGIDETEKIKSLADPTIIWFEEPTELLPSEFRQMNLRLRGNTQYYKQAILTFNPIHEFHWLREEFFSPQVEQALKNKMAVTTLRRMKVRDKLIPFYSTMIHSTYLDNKFIDDEYAAILEELKYKDPYFYEVYCLGNWGVLGELVFSRPWTILTEFPQEFDKVFYGFDWGYHHPSTLMKIGVKDGRYYIYEKFFGNKVERDVLIKKFAEENLIEDRTDIVYYDSAEPELQSIFDKYGFYAKPALKGNNSVIAGIDLMKSVEIFSHADNSHLNKELQTYKWEVDKNGQPIEGKVLKVFDDCIDATRYGIYSDSQFHEVKTAFIR